MKIVTVVPLSRGVFRENLSYFTADTSVTPGMIVSVPVRSRLINGLVSEVREGQELKADLKSSEFSLRKVLKLKGKPMLSKEFMEAITDTAHFYAATTGAVLGAYLPKAILGAKEISPENVSSTPKNALRREPLVIQASDEERFGEYRSLVRERFARGQSVYLCFPTTQEADDLMLSLDRGIKEYSYLLHSSLPNPKIVATWKNALKEKHPVLIIGTGAFLSIPRADIGTIVIEKESSRFYKSSGRVPVDTRVFAEFFARRKKIELIYGDTSVRVETLYKVEANEYAEFGSALKSRMLWPGTYKIIDMRDVPDESDKPKTKKRFEILSDELKMVIAGLGGANEHLFLFTSRRGLSPLTLCGDCGTVVTCTRCSAPTTLHRGGANTFFLCHHCGEKRGADERCRVCTSWKLETLGVGIERVEEELKKLFPKMPLFRLDAETAKTNKKALDIASQFYKSPSGILIGTEISLFYLKEKIQNAGVVSIDSLFALPDFRINERIFSMLLFIRGKTEKKFIIQTRNTEATVLGFAATGNLSDFYREEIETRKEFNYPPFTTLIKITLEGKKETIEKEVKALKEYLSEYELDVFPAFISMIKGKSIINALMKIPREKWPDNELLSKLQALPPSHKVQIDPESIL